jgi:2-methylisocitrate lyase-like PEP mutase family enzyme
MTRATVASAGSIRRAEAFTTLHAGPSPLILLNAWDAASAAVFARAGALALGTTSAGVAWSAGYADGERMAFADLVGTVANICRVVAIPVSVDIERGFGTDAAEVARNAAAVIEAGAIGINIEDGVDPATGALRPAHITAERIAAIRAMADARGLPLFINARTDVYFLPAHAAQRRFEQAVERLAEYRRAGADGAFVPGLTDTSEIARLAPLVALPLNVYAGHAGVPPIAQLRDAGARRISVGCGPLQGLLGQAGAMAREILERGVYDRMLDSALDAPSVNGLFPEPVETGSHS